VHADPEPWTISDDRVVAETPLFRVRAERCVTADGYELAYYLIDTADWVNVVAITEELELVAVRHRGHAFA
jgi:8-oxo-dGDP phosphatase